MILYVILIMQQNVKTMSLFKMLRPGIPKRGLFLVAGIVWTIAGGMLLSRGTFGLLHEGRHLFLEFIGGLCFGIVFYYVMFSKISLKHLNRITAIEHEKPNLFSFFNLKSYIMMTIMISGGITLRTLNIINHQVLFTFYVIMGIPLFLSALRFYKGWWNFDKSL